MDNKLFSHQKEWSDFTKEELIKIAKMLSNNSYGSIDLNMNDVFAPAAMSTDCDEFDLIAVSELYKEFGNCGPIAWAAVKEGIDSPWRGSYPNFKKAKEKILSNETYYFWRKKYKEVYEHT